MYSIYMPQLLTALTTRLITPHSQHADVRRQEQILNTLLTVLLLFSSIAVMVSAYSAVFSPVSSSQSSLIMSGIFFGLTMSILIASRKGFIVPAAISFIGLLSLTALQLALQYGFDLQQALLAFVLVGVVAGVTTSATFALIYTAGLAIVLAAIGYMQAGGSLQPDRSWVSRTPIFGDAVGYALTLLVIGLVCWLSNREIDASLARARASEAALAKERDNLEIKVRERTQALEQEQLIRVMELRRFAEFGRLSANLLHEVANPLTAASINLEQIDSKQHSSLVVQARKNLRQLERYVQAARKQLKGQGEITTFDVRTEMGQLMRLVGPLAQKQHVTVLVNITGKPKLTGDAIKFNQLIANLVRNAVESYSGSSRPAEAKQVMVTISARRHAVTCSVQDWGKGIAATDLPHIFEPFYTNKASASASMGIGLFMVKQFVEQDFKGTISASSGRDGTLFTVNLRSIQ